MGLSYSAFDYSGEVNRMSIFLIALQILILYFLFQIFQLIKANHLQHQNMATRIALIEKLVSPLVLFRFFDEFDSGIFSEEIAGTNKIFWDIRFADKLAYEQ